MRNKREAVVLAGGFGTRLAHIVKDVPKPMAPVAGRPFLRYILDMLAENSFSHVVIADGYKRECIEGYFGNVYRGMTISYSSEDKPLFTGGAVKKALRLCNSEWVYVLNGDTYLDIRFDSFENAALHASSDTTAFIATRTMHNVDRYGLLEIDTDGVIKRFIEKQHCETGRISAGAYYLRRDALEMMPDVFSLETDYFEQVVRSGCLRSVACEGMFIDIGIPEDYERAQELFKPMCKQWRIAFFDRDGTINVDTGHLYEPEKLEIIPECITLLRRYSHKPDWKVVVATNQAGIAKGMYTVNDMNELHRSLDGCLEVLGCKIDAYYYCPHHPDYTGACGCRKPASGMLRKALFDFEAQPENCILFGDKQSDIEAAGAVGIESVLVNWANGDKG